MLSLRLPLGQKTNFVQGGDLAGFSLKGEYNYFPEAGLQLFFPGGLKLCFPGGGAKLFFPGGFYIFSRGGA